MHDSHELKNTNNFPVLHQLKEKENMSLGYLSKRKWSISFFVHPRVWPSSQ